MKTCSKCKIEKALKEFYERNKVGYVHSWCRKCTSELSSLRYKKYRKNIDFRIRSTTTKIKCNSRKKNIKFNITPEYMIQLWIEQNGKCYLTGNKMKFYSKEGFGMPKDQATVDKINPKLGYTLGNVQWATWQINSMKRDLLYKDFIKTCKKVYKRSK
jgi:hypothetical protein